MTELKCPFCGQKLDYNKDYAEYQCWNPNCEQTNACVGSKNLWQALIDTKKKLDVCVSALKEISLRFQNEEEAIVRIWCITAKDMCDCADEAIEQINEITKGE